MQEQGDTFHCIICGRDKPVHTSGGTGYATDRKGRRICYQCTARWDRREMDCTGRATLYLVHNADKSWAVTNWPGTLHYRAGVRIGGHNWGLTRYDVWFTDHVGREWHGVTIGDDTQICHCKRLKGA